MYSFDVFDTLVARKVYSPQAIFKICQEQLKRDRAEYNISSYFAENFMWLRIMAEKDAERYSKDTVSLQDIYSALKRMVSDSTEQLDRVMALEIQTEIENTVGIKRNIQHLLELQKAGEKIVLISDMYLPAQAIEKILINVEPQLNNLKIYVSSQYKVTKQSGLLYVKVKEIEDIPYSEWTHIGDNHYSDVLIPELLGIATDPVILPDFREWEHRLLDFWKYGNSLVVQYVLGATVNIRREREFNEHEVLGLSFAGPILFPYVKWIIDICLAKEIERLYFVSRDGYVLKKIADIYIQGSGLNIATKYIYGSRRAWRVTEPEKRDAVAKYMSQELDLSNDKFAFVDLQGFGISISCLAEIMNQKINVFYYNLMSNEYSSHCNFYTYSFSKNSDSIDVEVLCRAPHGVVTGYELENGRMISKFEDIKTDWEGLGLYDYFKGVEQYAEYATNVLKNVLIDLAGAEVSGYLLAYAMQSRDQKLCEFLGDMPFNCTTYGEENITYAPKLSGKDIFNAFFWKPSNPSIYYCGTNFNFSLNRLNERGIKWMNVCKYFSNSPLGYRIRRHHNERNGIVRSVRKIRLIIYGAGQVGHRLHKMSHFVCGMKIVAWADVDYVKYQKEHLPVIALKEAVQKEYDYIVIAIKKQTENVKKVLMEAGVPESRLITYDQLMTMLNNDKR